VRLALVALLCGACGDDVSGLLVRFQSGRSIPDEADTIEVRIVGDDDGEEVDRQTYDLGPVGAFPATLGITRGPSTPERVRIEGTLYVDDAIVAAGAAVTAFVDGANRQVDVTLVE
jgi:hypothetical protein